MCSVSRARADSSPLPQAFNRFVISAGRAWMNGPFSRGPSKNIPETWPVLGGDCRLYRWKRANLFQKTGGTNEIRRNFGGDAQCLSRKRLRTTDARKRKHVVFWKWWAQCDRPETTQLEQRGRECCREQYARPVHVSRYQGCRDFSATVQHLLRRVFSKCVRRGHTSLSRRESVEGQSKARS